MPMRFDAATRYLLDIRPLGWLQYAGLPMGEVEVVEADISMVSAAADKVVRVQAERPWRPTLSFRADTIRS